MNYRQLNLGWCKCGDYGECGLNWLCHCGVPRGSKRCTGGNREGEGIEEDDLVM
jgi:hypothetical protein